jgi:anti-sigma regulatory factor (Ser/Thr protein kinase)
MPDAEADLVLAVNEAAANAIDHAYRTDTDTGDGTGDGRVVVEVFFWTEPGAVLLEVVDHGRWRPPGSPTAGGGRGIAIMQRLVDAVLIHHDACGTRVLLRHTLPGRPRPVLPHTASSAVRAR